MSTDESSDEFFDEFKGSDRLNDVIMMMLTTQRASWEQGVAGQALLEYYQFLTDHSDQGILPKPIMRLDGLKRLLYGMAHEAVLRRSTDGRLATRVNSDDQGSNDGGALDPACIGQAVDFIIQQLEKEQLKGEQVEGKKIEEEKAKEEEVKEWKQALDEMINYLEAKAPGMRVTIRELPLKSLMWLSHIEHDRFVLSHTARKPQLWIDGVYMAPPFLVTYALRQLESGGSNWEKYLYSGLDQVALYFYYLQLPSGLLAHMYDCESRSLAKEEGGGMYGAKPWGVGNGWAVGGIARILNILHRQIKKGSEKDQLLIMALENSQGQARMKTLAHLLRETLDSILKYIREDGLFHNVINDPSTFVETNLSQMLSATLFRLLHLLNLKSELDELFDHGVTLYPQVNRAWVDRMTEKAEVMRNAAVKKVDQYGFVRGVASSPRFDRPGTATEGQAWFVLMEVARAEYLLSLKKSS